MKKINSITEILLVTALAAVLPSSVASAASITKANTPTLNTTADWNAGAGPVPTILDTATWQSSPISLSNNLALSLGGADLNCLGLDLRPNGTVNPSLRIASGNTINLSTGGANQSNGAWDSTFNCSVNLVGNATFNIQGDMKINGSITQDATARSLTKSGSGALLLTGANNYSGGTIISKGILSLSGSGTLGSTTAGVLTLSGSRSGTTLDLGGTTQTVGGVVNFGGGEVRNGTLIINAGGNAITKSGLVSANLQGTGNLYLDDNGLSLILSGANAYSGTTIVQGGTILAAKPAALPNSGASPNVITLNSANNATLAVRAGGSGEWGASDISSLLGNAAFTVAGTSAIGLGIDTTGGDFTYGNAIPAKANLGLLKLGPNTLTLSAANLYTRPTTITRGTVNLDAAAGGSLAATSGLTFSGTGTFNYNTASISQSLGALTFFAGEGTVQLTRSTDQALTFASLVFVRTNGASANFSLSGGTPSALNGFNLTGAALGFINQGLFFGGADYAYMDAAGTFVRAPIYGTDLGFTTAGLITAGTHVKLTATPAAQPEITLNTLNLAGSGVGFPLSGTLTLANGGLLKSGGGTVGTISGGAILTATNELVVRTDSSSDSLTISSPIGFSVTNTATITTASATLPVNSTNGLVVGMAFRNNNNTAGRTIASIDSATQVTLSGAAGGTAGVQPVWFGYFTDAVTKSGAGTLTLSGANLFGGGVNLNAGQLNINSGTALGAGFFVSGAGVNVSRFTINEGTTIDNTSGNDLLAMTYKYSMTWNGSFTFLGSSDLSFIDPSGNGTIYMPRDVTVTVNAKTLKIPANFSGTFAGSQSANSVTTASITKNGPGALWIGSNGDSGYTGGLIVNNGVLVGPGIAGGQSHALFSGPVSLGDTTPGNTNNATINMYGPSNTDIAHTAPITVRAGSSGTLAITADNNGGARKYLFDGPLVLNNNLTLSAINNSGNSIDIYGVVSGTGALNIGNTGSFTVSAISATPRSLTNLGTVTLWRANPYSGNTLVNSGTLKLGAQASINSSPLISLAAGTTLDVSQIAAFTLGGSTLTAKGTTNTVAGWARIIGYNGGTVSLGAQPLNLTFTPTSASGDSTHPALLVSQGALTLDNNTITVNNAGPALAGGAYRLIQVANGSAGVINENVSPSYPVTVTGNGLVANSTATVSVSSGNLIMTVVTREVTSFSALSVSQTIEVGTTAVTLSGTVSTAGSVYPADGEEVYATIYGVSVTNIFSGGAGGFLISFPTAAIPSSGTPYPIQYSYAGSSTLLPAVDTTTTLTVSGVSVPTIYAWPTTTTIIYGQALTSSTINGDGSASVGGTFSFTVPATAPPAGTYAASGTFTPDNTNTSAIVVVPGAISVTVDPATLTLGSAAVATKPYDGTIDATITGTLNGVLSGDLGQVTLVGTGSFQSPAPSVGTGIAVDAACTLSGIKATNYFLTQPLSLSADITQAILTVKADNLGRPAGVTNPPLAYTVTGYQNGEDEWVVGLSVTPVLNTEANLASPEDSYIITITPGEGDAVSSPNYSLYYANGTLKVIGLRTWAKGNGAWDIETSTNWTSSSGPATYVDGGEVLFNAAAAGVGPYTVTLNTTVSPFSVIVSNTAKDYTITNSGGGRIAGTASLTKQGSATLTLAGANAYSGGTLVSNGTLQYGSKDAFGSGIVTLAGGTAWKKINEEGNSASLATANEIVLSGGFVTTDVSFGGGKDMWLSGPITGPGGLLVISDTSGRSLTLSGTKTFEGGVTIGGGAASNPTLTIDNVDSMGTGILRSELTTASGSLNANADLSTDPGVTNCVDIAPGAQLRVRGASLLLSGPITGGGSLVKDGTAVLVLSGVNTYGGKTTVSGGTLQVVNAASLGTGPLSITNAFVQLDDTVNTPQVTSLTFDKGTNYQTSGTWGSSSSLAANKDDHFTGSGLVLVGPAATTTTVTSTSLSGTNGGSVALTATVVAQSPSLAIVSEGTVTFTATNDLGATVGSVTSGTVSLGAISATLSLTNIEAGTYGVIATYNPAVIPPNFTTSTSASHGVLTVVKGMPIYNSLAASQATAYGTTSVKLGGQLSAVTGPVYPANGETVTASINGLAQNGTVTNATGGFSITYLVGTSIPVSGTPYPITYTYAGNATTLKGATNVAITTLTVTNGPSIDCNILTFSTNGIITGTNIAWTVPFGSVLASLVPIYTLSPGATCIPASGGSVDFSGGPVTYTVTAANTNYSKAYLVTVTVASDPALAYKDILTFDLGGTNIGAIKYDNIYLQVTAGTPVTNLVPTYTVSPGASGAPLSDTPRDFTTAQTYTVTAADLSTKVYTVTVIVDGPPVLIGHWVSGPTNLTDASGYTPAGTHDGQAVGTNAALLAWNSDVPSGYDFTGKSLDLSASNVAVQIGNTAANDAAYRTTFDQGIGTKFTTTFWFKGPVGTLTGTWVGKSGNTPFGWKARPLSPKADFTMRDNTGEPYVSSLTSSNSVDDGAWHHIAEVLDGWTSFRKIYVDGVLQGETTGTNNPVHIATLSHLILGSTQGASTGTPAVQTPDAPIGATGGFFTGQLYDVRMYNGPLDAAAVVTAMTTPLITAVPIPILTTIVRTNEVLTLKGTTDIAGKLVVERTLSLKPITWEPIQTNAVLGGAFSIPVTRGADAKAFYRVGGTK